MCAKEVFALLAELRESARENQEPLPPARSDALAQENVAREVKGDMVTTPAYVWDARRSGPSEFRGEGSIALGGSGEGFGGAIACGRHSCEDGQFGGESAAHHVGEGGNNVGLCAGAEGAG